MLDDLRSSSVFIEEEPLPEAAPAMRELRSRRRSDGKFLGMNAVQRFIISVMLFLMVFVVGVLALLASGSIYIPF